jgi:CheY-like chemotaxis protein
LHCKFRRKIPVFLMSAYIEPAALEAMAGFDAKFAKPVDIDTLIARVGACIPA